MAKERDKRPGNVNTYLSVELAEKFLQVKAYYGISTNADVVRFLIKKEAREIDEPHPTPFSVPQG